MERKSKKECKRTLKKPTPKFESVRSIGLDFLAVKSIYPLKQRSANVLVNKGSKVLVQIIYAILYFFSLDTVLNWAMVHFDKPGQGKLEEAKNMVAENTSLTVMEYSISSVPELDTLHISYILL